MVCEDLDAKVDYTDKNQIEEVNPYAARVTDDTDAAFDGTEQEDFSTKPIAQADVRGNLQEVPTVRKMEWNENKKLYDQYVFMNVSHGRYVFSYRSSIQSIPAKKEEIYRAS